MDKCLRLGFWLFNYFRLNLTENLHWVSRKYFNFSDGKEVTLYFLPDIIQFPSWVESGSGPTSGKKINVGERELK